MQSNNVTTKKTNTDSLLPFFGAAFIPKPKPQIKPLPAEIYLNDYSKELFSIILEVDVDGYECVLKPSLTEVEAWANHTGQLIKYYDGGESETVDFEAWYEVDFNMDEALLLAKYLLETKFNIQ